MLLYCKGTTILVHQSFFSSLRYLENLHVFPWMTVNQSGWQFVPFFLCQVTPAESFRDRYRPYIFNFQLLVYYYVRNHRLRSSFTPSLKLFQSSRNSLQNFLNLKIPKFGFQKQGSATIWVAISQGVRLNWNPGKESILCKKTTSKSQMDLLSRQPSPSAKLVCTALDRKARKG